MARLLLTGATGFVGSHLIEGLVERGHVVSAAVRHRPHARLALEGVTWHPLNDAVQREDWSAMLDGVDTVIHLTAHAHVSRPTPADLQLFETVNVSMTERLAEACHLAGVRRFIYLSTAGVLGDLADHPLDGRAEAHPVSQYAKSKWQAECALQRILADSACEWVIIRPPLVYGPGMPGNFRRLVTLVESGVPLPFAGIDNRRSFISVWNLCSFIEHAIVEHRCRRRIWLVADREVLTTPQLIRLIAASSDRQANLWRMPVGVLKVVASLLGRRQDWSRLTGSFEIDPSATFGELGWSPPLSAAEGWRKSLCHH